jgi:hypothetical protein
MQTKSPYRIITVARFVVNTSFYLSLLFLIGYLGLTTLKVMNQQPAALTFGDAAPNQVYTPIAWKVPGVPSVTGTHTGSEFSLSQKESSGELMVPARSAVALWDTIGKLLSMGLYIWILALLRQILTFGHGKSPFQPQNARSIGRMGLLFITLSVWATLHELVLYQLTKPYLTGLDPALYSPFEWSISLSGPWLLGLILLALAQVYVRGHALEEEVELTV